MCQWFTPKKKHGFIKPDGAGADVFVHEMDMRAGHAITEGDDVEFGTEDYKGREKAIDVIKVDAAVRSAVAPRAVAPPGAAVAPARRVLPPPRPWGAVDAGLSAPAPAVPPQNGAAPVFPKPSWAPPAAKAAAPAAPAPAALVAAAPSWPRAAAPAAPAAPKPAAAAPKPAGPRGWGQVDSAPSFASNDAGPTPGEAMRRA